MKAIDVKYVNFNSNILVSGSIYVPENTIQYYKLINNNEINKEIYDNVL